jgi:hypothetical protein
MKKLPDGSIGLRILAIAPSDFPLTHTEICARLGDVSENSSRQSVKRLAKYGYLRRVAWGLYELGDGPDAIASAKHAETWPMDEARAHALGEALAFAKAKGWPTSAMMLDACFHAMRYGRFIPPF